jgi:hypothetical protein
MFKEVQNSLTDYGKILRKSWESTWNHKSLWLFAVLAGGINSGVIFHNLVRGTWRLEPTDAWSSAIIEQSIDGLPWLLRYLQEIFTLEPARMIGSLAILAIAVALFIFLSIAGQQILVTGLTQHSKSKRVIAFSKIVKEVRHMHFWQLFSINAFMHLSLALTVLALAFPLTTLLGAAPAMESLIYFAFYVILVPIIFVVHAFSMFAMIYTIRHNASLHEIVSRSWKMLSQHWLAAFELSVLLFFVNILVALIGSIITLLTIVPLGIIAFTSTAGGSMTIAIGLGIMGLIALTIFSVIVGGAMITFNYSTWVHLVERSERSGILPALEHTFLRIRKFFAK